MKDVYLAVYNLHMSGSLVIRNAIEAALGGFPSLKLLSPKYPSKRFNFFYRILLDQAYCAFKSFSGRLVMFGNVPCVFSLGRQAVFFHNVNYFKSFEEVKDARLFLELLYFKCCVFFTTSISKDIVWLFQTDSVKNQFLKLYPDSMAYVVGSPQSSLSAKPKQGLNPYLFYPASGAPHKNHKFLSLVKSLLDDKYGLEVVVTAENDLGLKSVGQLSFDDVYDYLLGSAALVFPSKSESLGVPLLEASSLGVPILAPDLPYVNSVLNDYYRYAEDDIPSFEAAVQKLLLDLDNNDVQLSSLKVDTDPISFLKNICNVIGDS